MIVVSSKSELKRLIALRIKEHGSDCDLNDIDVSHITDMSYMFYDSTFKGDISKWDVSNVTNMDSMFCNTIFDGDISGWDVHNLRDMSYMFIYSPLSDREPSWYKK